MILGGSKVPVVENMREAVLAGDLNRKVETDDPVMSDAEAYALVRRHFRHRQSMTYFYANRTARFLADVIGTWYNRSTKYTGLENLDSVEGGAIITSNHFNPIDTTIVRSAMKKAGRDRMFIVSQVENLAMKGFLGFFTNYTDILPISRDKQYMARQFPTLLGDVLKNGHLTLIYPEEEMWLNYRKPRRPKRGAYYYAAKFNVPIISCFIEIREKEGMETPEFAKTRYIVHVLPTIYPPAGVSLREASQIMMKQDFLQKKDAYEEAYGKKLTYAFSYDDVAGYRPPENNMS